MARTFRKFFFFPFVYFALSACSGQLYKVATPPKVTPPPLNTAESGFVAAGQALTSDEAMAQFDANLLLAGVVAVDMRVANRTSEAIPLNTLRWELSDDGRTLFKLLTPKKALSRVMRHYGNRLYLPTAYEATRARYETLALPLTAALAPQEERRGFLFFETKYEATSLSGLTLIISGWGDPRYLKLD